MSNELWEKYCRFLEKSLSEQLQYSIKLRDKLLEKWLKTKTAKQIAAKFNVEIKKFEDVPLTDFSDYPILVDFREKINQTVSRRPRRKGELWWDYYKKVMEEVSPLLSEWLPEPFGYAAKTSGTFGESKWVAHGETGWKNLEISTFRMSALSCSDSWGETRSERGDKALNILAPVPYLVGYSLIIARNYFELVPPIEVTDNITDIRRKLMITLKEIEKVGGVVGGPGIASFFYLAVSYFENPEKFYYDYYKSLNFGIAKIFMLLKFIQAKLTGKKRSIRELMPLKGAIISGVDTPLYYPIFERIFGIKPLNVYGSTELGIVMGGTPERKDLLMPSIDICFFEFLDKNGEIKQLDELKKGEVYECVGTPFNSLLLRYKTGDLFRLIEFRDDGFPLFSFEGRRSTRLNIYGYFDLTEALATKILSRAGLSFSDKWAVAKILSPKEHLHFLMEKEWEYSEEEAAKRIFKAFLEESEDFRSYVKDFRVRNPTDIIKVEYLKKGAFLRYFLKRVKEGVPPGQVKPPKVIPSERMDIFETLRRI